MIDGATNATNIVAAGSGPNSLAINPYTNKIYIANQGDNTVTVIDGATNITASVPTGGSPFSVGVNPVTNKIYVANGATNNLTVIDGATNTTTTVAAGLSPTFVAVNPVTSKIYVSNFANVTVLSEEQVQAIPLTTTISALPNNQTNSSNAAFIFSTSATFSPVAPPVDGVYYQLDTWQGRWTRATVAPAGFVGVVGPLSAGIHILYAYATDGQDAPGSFQGNSNNSPVIGSITAYVFLCAPAKSSGGGTIALLVFLGLLALWTPLRTLRGKRMFFQ
jgi:YVTN family beta-propeller protein